MTEKKKTGIEMMSKNGFIYIITNKSDTVFYIGVTSNLEKRIYEHKNKLIKGFTTKYNVSKLVYFEVSNDITAAIQREKQLKNWHRDWKVNLIKENNPDFKDLYPEITGNAQ
jgi:Predicted endonuclease containing a URI domain